MRAGFLILSCVVHGVAVTAALGVGVYAGKRLQPSVPRVHVATSVPADPAPPPAITAPTVVVEAVAEPLALAEPAIEDPVEEPVAEPELPEPARLREPMPAATTPTLQQVVVRPPAATPESPPAPAGTPRPDVEAEPRSDNEPPRYPDHDRRQGNEGTVVVGVVVDALGAVLETSLATPSPFPGLNREALRAVRGWRFAPAQRHGEPIASRTTVTIVFRLQR